MHMDLKKSHFAKFKYLKEKLSRPQTPAAMPAKAALHGAQHGEHGSGPCDHRTFCQPKVSSWGTRAFKYPMDRER